MPLAFFLWLAGGNRAGEVCTGGGQGPAWCCPGGGSGKA